MDQKSGQENMAVEERWPLWRGSIIVFDGPVSPS